MTDKNGNTIQAGDIVEIKDAYFKNDQGFWYVEQDGTNEAYLGTDLTLRKIGKSGKISTAKNNLAFWPLKSYCSDHVKNALADEWNEKYATIEITDKVNSSQVIEAFKEKAKESAESIEYYEMRGYGPAWTENHEKNLEYCKRVLARLEAPKTAEPAYTDIWNNAYTVYCEGDYFLMWDYLREQINNKNLSTDDAETIAENIANVVGL